MLCPNYNVSAAQSVPFGKRTAKSTNERTIFMKKSLSVLLTLAFILCAFSVSCARKPQHDSDVSFNVAVLKGPTGMGAAKLIGDEYENYNVTVESSPDAVTGKFISGEYDVAAVPVNLASVLYNKLEGDVVMLGVTTLGVLYVVENGNEVNSIADLAGKPVDATGQGSTPEYIINYLLEKNDISDKVEINYHAEHSELTSLLGSGSVRIGILPEPNVTAVLNSNPDLRIALNLTEEWNKVCSTECVQGVLIARKGFAAENKTAVEQFIKDYAESSDFVVNNIDDASKLIVEAGILPSEDIAKKAIPNCNIVFYSGERMKKAAEGMYSVLFASNPKSIGGKLPEADFYFGA